MVSLAAGCLGFALVGIAPFGVDDMGSGELAVRIGALAATAVTLLLVVVCVLKGKPRMALFGIFVPVLALVGALRLARPDSVWARHRYDDRQRAHARARSAAFDRRVDPELDRISDAVAGRPSRPDPPPSERR
jgi:hypothetical protein